MATASAAVVWPPELVKWHAARVWHIVLQRMRLPYMVAYRATVYLTRVFSSKTPVRRDDGLFVAMACIVLSIKNDDDAKVTDAWTTQRVYLYSHDEYFPTARPPSPGTGELNQQLEQLSDWQIRASELMAFEFDVRSPFKAVAVEDQRDGVLVLAYKLLLYCAASTHILPYTEPVAPQQQRARPVPATKYRETPNYKAVMDHRHVWSSSSQVRKAREQERGHRAALAREHAIRVPLDVERAQLLGRYALEVATEATWVDGDDAVAEPATPRNLIAIVIVMKSFFGEDGTVLGDIP